LILHGRKLLWSCLKLRKLKNSNIVPPPTILFLFFKNHLEL
jgi:hypothetical protein